MYGLGKLIYKCRRCGEVHEPYGVPRTIEAALAIVKNGHYTDGGFLARLVDIHNCKDGALGVTDFIGAMPDSERG